MLKHETENRFWSTDLQRALVVVGDEVDGDSLTAEPAATADPENGDSDFSSGFISNPPDNICAAHLWM